MLLSIFLLDISIIQIAKYKVTERYHVERY